MKTAADTSVLAAAFASWHEHHGAALAPHRMTPNVVSTYLDKSFGGCAVFALPSIKLLTLDTRAHRIYALLAADHEMVA